MRKKLSKIIVTGGAGFIGSEFTKQAVKRGCEVVVVDKLTYAGDLKRLEEIKGKYKFYKVDICNRKKMSDVFKKENPQIVVHFAAESHVDRSIKASEEFIETNIKGTYILLEESRNNNIKRFIHISTDEVYGDIKKGKFSESSPLNPSSPYSASKAAADCLVKSYIRTYGFPAIIVRPSNNYGPWQYPEKFIPVVIFKALNKQSIPLYGSGLNKREWLYVSDCADAIFYILEKGKTGEIYNLGSSNEKGNLDVAHTVLKVFRKKRNLIRFVKDRPGHDYRYALNSSKITGIGWRPKVNFETGIIKTANWYKSNYRWLSKKVEGLKQYWKNIYKKP